MKGSEILQNLFDERDALSDIIINSTPKNDNDQKKMQAVMQQRDTITGAINQIIANKFNEVAATGLADKISDLAKLTDKLNALDKTLKNIDTVIQIADQSIKLITSIIAIAVVL
ncbi:MAG: hypothetical protein ABSD50_10305 [Smithella sp.]|jgi:hypothetical protein